MKNDYEFTVEDDGPTTMQFTDANLITFEPQLTGTPGIEGLDELAAELGVKPGGSNGIVLQGRSGESYDWVELLTAHLQVMRKPIT